MPVPLRIIFAGTPAFAVPALEGLVDAGHEILAVYTQPDRPAGRGRIPRAPPVKEAAVGFGLRVEQPPTLKDTAIQRRLSGWHPDVLVVAAYGQLLPARVLRIPRLGCINVHASLLPRWRGAAPIQRAILAGDAETGISIMQMDEGLDTGPVLARAAIPIETSDTAASLHDKLAALGATTLLSALAELADGALMPEPQDESRATYATRLVRAEAELDWTRSAAFLARCVRAFNPWPVAFTLLNGSELRIWEAEAGSEELAGVPGTVMRAGPKAIVVATGTGVLRVLKVQPAGRRSMSAAAFVNARSLEGVRLG